MSDAPLIIRGVEIHQGYLGEVAQQAILEDLRAVLRVVPLVQPETRWGKPMSVRMSAAGRYGWISDRRGYRYVDHHPNGVAWPPIPPRILEIWHNVTGLDRVPECCLINYYGPEAKMGLHQDRDEADFSYPVVSISLGDDARFRLGHVTRGGPTESIWLHSGDVAVMGGEARLIYHGVDRLRPGSRTVMPKGGRINLTLRVVD